MSTTEAAKDKLEQATGQAQEKAQEIAGQARGRAREQIDQRSTQAGEQLSSFAKAIRKSGEELRSQDQHGPARAVDRASEQAERLSAYLKDSDADRILRDAEDFARRQPWALATGAFILGLLGSRFIKASSSRRYEEQAATKGSDAAAPVRAALPAPPPRPRSRTPR
jgi:gas vesicle protein